MEDQLDSETTSQVDALVDVVDVLKNLNMVRKRTFEYEAKVLQKFSAAYRDIDITVPLQVNHGNLFWYFA